MIAKTNLSTLERTITESDFIEFEVRQNRDKSNSTKIRFEFSLDSKYYYKSPLRNS